MQTSNTTTVSKTAQKYLAIIATGRIEESEIISLKSFINKSKENRDIIFDKFYDVEGLELSTSQNQKGLDFLLNQWKTPTGKERQNNPFGYREQKALETFTHFTLYGWYDAGNYGNSYYLPIYYCHGTECSFEYYYNGKVNIIG